MWASGGLSWSEEAEAEGNILAKVANSGFWAVGNRQRRGLGWVWARALALALALAWAKTLVAYAPAWVLAYPVLLSSGRQGQGFECTGMGDGYETRVLCYYGARGV